MKLSIIIPCYNEKQTIQKIVSKILNIKINKEIIIVDDGSIDGTKELIKLKFKNKEIKKIFHKKNLGKGAAIRSGQKLISGEIVIIQDADLEYYPSDYLKLIKPIINKQTKVVYGSRILGKKKYKYNKNFYSYYRVLGNYILTIISNIINHQKLTDAHTCYKVFDSKLFRKIKLEENDFAFCPEITSKISNLNEYIIEIPIKYSGRNYQEGKKIRFVDAIIAFKTLFYYGFLKK
tara:strand:+ start:1215 stop:1916 length:702 start_codon:yes stop_codon:yes gene_type:complete